MDQTKTGRREFIVKACMVVPGALLGAVIAKRAAAANAGPGMDMGEMAMGHGGSDGYVIDSSMTKHCGTCEFWGGQRRVAENGKTITITSLGWCNNPVSPNYRKLTSPDHGPMATWKKWQVLG